jgi:hypothetical protein
VAPPPAIARINAGGREGRGGEGGTRWLYERREPRWSTGRIKALLRLLLLTRLIKKQRISNFGKCAPISFNESTDKNVIVAALLLPSRPS